MDIPQQQIIYQYAPSGQQVESPYGIGPQIQPQYQQASPPPAYQIVQQQLPQQQFVREQQSKDGYTYVFTVPEVIKPECINCIFPATEEQGGLYLGNLDAAMSVEVLKKHKIRAVLTASIETGVKYAEEVIHFHEYIPAHDRDDYDITQHFEKAFEFIERNRKYTSVLVHCYAGVSRSASLVIAYLMKVQKWSLEKALWFTKQKRRYVNPNPGFIRKLMEYEKHIFGVNSIKLKNKNPYELIGNQPQQQIYNQSIGQQITYQKQIPPNLPYGIPSQLIQQQYLGNVNPPQQQQQSQQLLLQYQSQQQIPQQDYVQGYASNLIGQQIPYQQNYIQNTQGYIYADEVSPQYIQNQDQSSNIFKTVQQYQQRLSSNPNVPQQY